MKNNIRILIKILKEIILKTKIILLKIQKHILQ
jgi:hypothetical protein